MQKNVPGNYKKNNTASNDVSRLFLLLKRLSSLNGYHGFSQLKFNYGLLYLFIKCNDATNMTKDINIKDIKYI